MNEALAYAEPRPFWLAQPGAPEPGPRLEACDEADLVLIGVFVGALVGTQLQRIVMNQRGLPIRRDMMLYELRQRIREVRQGPDGLIYLLTDEEHGALLRLEPVSAGS